MVKMLGIILAVVLLISMTAFTGCSRSDSSQDEKAAPDFKLNNLNGQSITLSSFRGKAVLINFWSTTCPPCLAEMPHFQGLYEDWTASNKAVVLTINMGESLSTVKSYIQSNKYTFPVLLDSEGEVAQLYGIQYTPTSILVGKDGLVKYGVIGAFKDKEAIVKAIGGYISEN